MKESDPAFHAAAVHSIATAGIMNLSNSNHSNSSSRTHGTYANTTTNNNNTSVNGSMKYRKKHSAASEVLAAVMRDHLEKSEAASKSYNSQNNTTGGVASAVRSLEKKTHNSGYHVTAPQSLANDNITNLDTNNTPSPPPNVKSRVAQLAAMFTSRAEANNNNNNNNTNSNVKKSSSPVTSNLNSSSGGSSKRISTYEQKKSELSATISKMGWKTNSVESQQKEDVEVNQWFSDEKVNNDDYSVSSDSSEEPVEVYNRPQNKANSNGVSTQNAFMNRVSPHQYSNKSTNNQEDKVSSQKAPNQSLSHLLIPTTPNTKLSYAVHNKSKSVKTIMNLLEAKSEISSNDPWNDVDTSTVVSSHALSEVTSSPKMENPALDLFKNNNQEALIDTSASLERVRLSGKKIPEDRSPAGIFRIKPDQPHFNAKFSPPGESYARKMEARDAPALMDDETTVASSAFQSQQYDDNLGIGQRPSGADSDIFDGLSALSGIQQDQRSVPLENLSSTAHGIEKPYRSPYRSSAIDDTHKLQPISEVKNRDYKSQLQTTSKGEKLAEDLQNMVMSYSEEEDDDSRVYSDSESSYYSDEDSLGQYYVDPKLVRKLVRYYRILSEGEDEDFTKAFALHEMRSRIMEADIDRGLERQGWTSTVDDIVTTPSNQTCCRIRDAVIVAKAWRDGASPTDVTTAFSLTKKQIHPYLRRRWCVGGGYWDYEQVRWLDDHDLIQMRCVSNEPKYLRGFDIFTIGDCQSLLLKLTNEQCVRLRKELQSATERQILAEDVMNEEANSGFEAIFEDDFMMTEAEMAYLTAMEEVKILSKSLVAAEKAFRLVRDRIERLVNKYEEMLMKLETDSYMTESLESTDSFLGYSDDDDEEAIHNNNTYSESSRAIDEAERRAQMALQAKEEAEREKIAKEREIQILQRRLEEMERRSELEKERSTQLVTEYEKQLYMERQANSSFTSDNNLSPIRSSNIVAVQDGDTKSYLQSAVAERDEEAVARVKAKFKSRFSQKTSQSNTNKASDYQNHRQANRVNSNERNKMLAARSGRREEMSQHLDFYERSLKAVNK